MSKNSHVYIKDDVIVHVTLIIALLSQTLSLIMHIYSLQSQKDDFK